MYAFFSLLKKSIYLHELTQHIHYFHHRDTYIEINKNDNMLCMPNRMYIVHAVVFIAYCQWKPTITFLSTTKKSLCRYNISWVAQST